MKYLIIGCGLARWKLFSYNTQYISLALKINSDILLLLYPYIAYISLGFVMSSSSA